MSVSHLRGVLSWALIVGLAFGAGAIVLAQQDESREEDRVIQIGQPDEENARPSVPPPNGGRALNQPGFPEQPQQELPKYWIGLLGGVIGDDHALRAHLDLPANQGLLVESVVPNGPAGKAGLKRHDILLRANDTDLRDMQDLIELVRTEGEKQGQITLEVLRHGERETVYVTPAERPADVQAQPPQGGLGEFPPGVDELLGQLDRGGQMPFDFRNFGPGVIIGGGRGIAAMPNGVSVSILKDEGQPAQITVRRGGETWEVVGDDPESLEQLPEDLRPFVEQLLQGNSPLDMDFQIPDFDRQGPAAGLNDERLRRRVEQMERRMEELQRRLLGPGGEAAEQEDAE